MSNLPPIDASVADLLRESAEMTISELAERLEVTATAVRQRLGRLMDSKLVQRRAVTEGRGRPSHRYSLTSLGRRQGAGNFADLAVALWEEIRLIRDPDVRQGLLQRVAGRMADSYTIEAKSLMERMKAVADLFGERRIPLTVGENGELPVLTAKCCPYPELAEQDRGVCAMEKMMLSEMVGEKLHLTECRLDGGTCCTFELSAS
jgi:predicted ArsR family transcriptional regulator